MPEGDMDAKGGCLALHSRRPGGEGHAVQLRIWVYWEMKFSEATSIRIRFRSHCLLWIIRLRSNVSGSP